ncbi:glycoside hydrolase family 25 protein [Streptomyces sp. NPDC094468]|uniref:glycoside hydrolase family 25 protein n=1 Tax=Streptomyces sp. NPDC094468 TaxID=3366066 RepID=UPI00382D7CC4
MIKGIDVSAYQSATYDTAGLDFVFTKITEGLTYVNPRWVQQRNRAKAAGLVWGAYHYPHMANDPKVEADFFLEQVAWQPGDVIVLDWEGYDDANRNVSKARQLVYRDAWLKYVKGKMAGHRVGMYCNTDYWTKVDTTSTCGDFLWIATGGRPAGSPGITHPWTFHQYSTANNIDHDVANFPSRTALAAWAGSAQQQPPEDPVAFTDADADLFVDRLLAADKFDAPRDAADYSDDPKNPGHYWSGRTVYRDLVSRVRRIDATTAANTAQVAALTAAVAALAQGGGLTAAEVQAAAEAGAKAALDQLGAKLQED